MSECIIHIGMHKTGTSSIQHSLSGLNDARFVYADLGDNPNHTLALYSIFTSRAEPHYIHKEFGRDAKAIAAYEAKARNDLERAVVAAEGRTLLLSGEGLATLSAADIATMRKYFEKRFDRVTVVAYIRAPVEFILSSFQQRLKGGRIEDLFTNIGFYKNRIAKFDDIFGTEQVRLFKYDSTRFQHGCVVRDFCERLGIDLPEERIVRLNGSLTGAAARLLYIYRVFRQGPNAKSMDREILSRLISRLALLGGDKLRLAPDHIHALLEINKADIEWMETRLGESLREDPGESRPGDIRDESDLLTVDADIVAQILARLGDRAPPGIFGRTPEELAILIDGLLDLDPAGKTPPGDRVSTGSKGNAISVLPPLHRGESIMNVRELIQHFQANEPELLEGIPIRKAVALIHGVYKTLNATIAETDEGLVRFEGLGRFRILKLKSEEGDEEIRTRIIFTRAARAVGAPVEAEREQVPPG